MGCHNNESSEFLTSLTSLSLKKNIGVKVEHDNMQRFEINMHPLGLSQLSQGLSLLVPEYAIRARKRKLPEYLLVSLGVAITYSIKRTGSLLRLPQRKRVDLR